MSPSDLIITGLGVVSSIGVGREAFTRSIENGVSGVIAIPDGDTPEEEQLVRRYVEVDGELRFDAETAVAAPVMGFDAKQYVKPRKALKVMCREIQTAYAASVMAVADSGLEPFVPAESSESSGTAAATDTPTPLDYAGGGKIASDRIGTVFGSEMLYGSPLEVRDAFAACIEADGRVNETRFGGAAMRGITPLWMLKYLPNMPACHVGIAINAHGPNNSITIGDTSGPAAMMEACGYLKRGIVDFMVVTACGTRLNATRALFTEDQPLATVCEPISRASRPHALDADGLVRGEAAGSLIVERESTAASRGARPLARILGYASRFSPSDAFRSGDRTAEIRPDAGRGSAAAIVAAMKGAMDMAGITANDLGGIVAHAIGDPVTDVQERIALEQVAPGVPLMLPAGLIGHTGAASGMMSLLTACTALQSRQVMPVIHCENCPESLNVSDRLRPLERNVVMSITHTSPGSATAIVLG